MALVAGLAGTWSPCGFSMIETIGPVGHDGGRPTTLAACLTFTFGALAGGAITFGSLALLGAAVHGAGESLAYATAAVTAACAALAELRGIAIVPQLRRQLPEHWRRLLPMPVAAGLYGVLLGLGFTTFVLTFGVFALAGIVFAVAEPEVGLAVGLAFGAGRAVPVALIAPIADREAGIRITETMAEHPAIYRGFRFGDGLALLVASAALVVAVPAGASRTTVKPAADPSPAGRSIAYQRPDGSAFLRRAGHATRLPGHDPAIGDGRVAVIHTGKIAVLSIVDLSALGRFPAKGADAVAISRGWVAWRAHLHGRDFIRARHLPDPDSPGPQHGVGSAGRRSQLGRPGVDGNRLVYARASEGRNTIVKRVLGARGRHAKSTLLRSRIDGLSNPSILGSRLLYVRNTSKADKLKLRGLAGHGTGKTLLSRRDGTLWSTALSAKRAYVTLIHGAAPQQRILSVKR